MKKYFSPLILLLFVALISIACKSGAGVTSTPTPFLLGTPGVESDVQAELIDPIPCERVGADQCKYTYVLKFKEQRGVRAVITEICLKYVDLEKNIYTAGGANGCENTSLTIQPGGSISDKERWVMTSNFIGGYLEVYYKVEDAIIHRQQAIVTKLEMPSWPTSTVSPK